MDLDLTAMTTVIGELKAKVVETEGTLAALAQAVVALQSGGTAANQAQIDALVLEAQGILARLSTAEDAADDHAGGAAPVGPS